MSADGRRLTTADVATWVQLVEARPREPIANEKHSREDRRWAIAKMHELGLVLFAEMPVPSAKRFSDVQKAKRGEPVAANPPASRSAVFVIATQELWKRWQSGSSILWGPEGSKPTATPEPISVPQYATLDQIAAMVGRSKKTLERAMHSEESSMPSPDIEGGGGKPHEWRWDRIRGWLEHEYKRTLPEKFPGRT